MATTHTTQIRTDDGSTDAHGVLLAAAYAGGILATILVATGAAYTLAGLTTGLGGFVLVAAGWLAAVSASPEVAERLALRLNRADVAARTPRTTKAATAVAGLLVR